MNEQGFLSRDGIWPLSRWPFLSVRQNCWAHVEAADVLFKREGMLTIHQNGLRYDRIRRLALTDGDWGGVRFDRDEQEAGGGTKTGIFWMS